MVDKKTVLLVDDDEDIIEPMKMILEQEFNIITAFSGKEGLEKAKANKPDLIVLDVIMETITAGFDTLVKIKDDTDTKAIPVIMMTSVNEEYDLKGNISTEYFQNNLWLDKPVDPQVLKGHIKELIG